MIKYVVIILIIIIYLVSRKTFILKSLVETFRINPTIRRLFFRLLSLLFFRRFK